MPRRSWFVLIAGVLLSCSIGLGRAHAQGNDLYAPAGGRSTLMGNTGVALGRDGSTPFYNPAAIVRIGNTRLAFAVNFYSLGLTHYSNWHQPGNTDASQFGSGNMGNTGLVLSSFRVLPSTLCLFFTLRELTHLTGLKKGEDEDEDQGEGEKAWPRSKLGICFATLESEDDDFQAINFRGRTAAGPTAQVQGLQRRWSRTYVGPTYSTYLNDSLAIGASLHAAYSYESFGINSDGVSARLGDGSVASSLGSAGSGYSFDATALIGATYRFHKLHLGASVRAPSLHLFGVYDGTFNQTSSGTGNDVSVISNARGTMKASTPMRFALGAGLTWRRLTLELDGALDVPVAPALSTSLNVVRTQQSNGAVLQAASHEEYAVRQHVVCDPSFGLEYFLNPTFSLLAGTSANFTTLNPLVPKPSVGNIVQARMSHVTASLGVGSYWPSGELLFGFQFDYGWGQALAVNPYVVPNGWGVVPTQAYRLMFVISGASDLGAIARVVRNITGSAPSPAKPNGGAEQGAPAEPAGR